MSTKKKSLSEPPATPEVGRRLQVARKELKLTQTALARRAGIDQAAVSKFETGGRGLEAPNLIKLLKAASELGINVEGWVLRGIGNPVHSGPWVLAQGPAVMDAAAELVRRLVEQERQKDRLLDEPKLPDDDTDEP